LPYFLLAKERRVSHYVNLVLENKPVLQDPGCFDKLSDSRVISGIVYFLRGIIETRKHLLKFCMRDRVVTRWSMFAEIAEEQRVLTDTLDRLEFKLNLAYARSDQSEDRP
jgi:hypothetical protein